MTAGLFFLTVQLPVLLLSLAGLVFGIRAEVRAVRDDRALREANGPIFRPPS